MNKLAAGALALALGLGAVAPSVAAEKSNYSGAQLFLERYEKELKEVNALRDKALVAEAKIAEAEKRLDAAKARLAAAKKAYEGLYPSHVFVLKDTAKGKDKTKLTLQDFYSPGELEQSELDEATKAIAKLVPSKTFNGMDVVNRFKEGKSYEWVLEDNQKYVAGTGVENPDTLEAAVRRLVNAAFDYYKNTKADSPRILAYQELVAAQGERDAAETNYRAVYAKYNPDVVKYNKALTKLTRDARGYGYVVQVGNSGLKLVKDGDAKIEAPKAKKNTVAELKRAKADAETAIKAVALLKELSPEKIKKVEAKLNEKVMKAQELIKKADAKIAELEKVAFVATAYADEADDTDALIKELDSTTGEIKDLIKDTPEDKKANEEKPAEKPEEKKPEEKTPSKKAGNNARTGIAGVAGVAGILAAASVAYAASKRD